MTDKTDRALSLMLRIAAYVCVLLEYLPMSEVRRNKILAIQDEALELSRELLDGP